MDNYEDKKKLLLDMIAFATIEGELIKKEFDFIFQLANLLNLERGSFMDLFHHELPVLDLSDELLRTQQFYRLALLMDIEGVLLDKDSTIIRQLAIHMGVSTEVAKKILKKMKSSPHLIISPEALTRIYKEEKY